MAAKVVGGRIITPEEKKELTERYLSKMRLWAEKLRQSETMPSTSTEEVNLYDPETDEPIHGFYFSADVVNQLVKQENFNGLFVELGAHDDLSFCTVLSAIDKKGNTLLSAEYSWPCPPICPDTFADSIAKTV
jgi:hypothetical protein